MSACESVRPIIFVALAGLMHAPALSNIISFNFDRDAACYGDTCHRFSSFVVLFPIVGSAHFAQNSRSCDESHHRIRRRFQNKFRKRGNTATRTLIGFCRGFFKTGHLFGSVGNAQLGDYFSPSSHKKNSAEQAEFFGFLRRRGFRGTQPSRFPVRCYYVGFLLQEGNWRAYYWYYCGGKNGF